MLFEPGQIVATPGALAHCNAHDANPMSLLMRHLGGDYGDLDIEDVKANEQAIQHDLRVLSKYVIADVGLYVITEADRSSTCILLCSEY